jgi:aminoglycoside phosphotransferase (APT) family kinase protein
VLETGGQPRAVCKFYGEIDFADARSKSKWIGPGDVLRVAPRLGRSDGRQALFFGWRAGRLLSEAVLEPSFDAAELIRVGVALAELHRQRIPRLPFVARPAEAQSLLESGDLLAFLLPKTSERLLNTARTLAACIGGWPQRDATTHGDFYAKQVLLHGDGGVTLLDFDEAGRGDPLSDLGTFLAHVEREVICGRLTVGRRDEILAALLEGYLTTAAGMDTRNLELYIAAKLFARMPHFFRTCDPHWTALTVQSLARVESLLGGRRWTHSKMEADPWRGRGMDEKMSTLSRAIDPVQAGPLLKSALREYDPDIARLRVRAVRLRRHKPGRRALIEYAIECRHTDGSRESLTLLGKLRRRGVDLENLRLIKQLVSDGFSADSTDGISIPQVLGQVPELALWLQQKVGGRSAAELFATAQGSSVARRAADAVCKLHRCQPPLRRTHSIADELTLLRVRLEVVATQRPAWKGRLEKLFEVCARLAENLAVVAPRPIHRDFYHDHILLEGKRVWLVDLDLLCAGDPALDAGNFIGHLIEWSVRAPAERPFLKTAADSFTKRFLEHSGKGTAEAVRVYTTLTLARHIFISTQFSPRAPFTETILEPQKSVN